MEAAEEEAVLTRIREEPSDDDAWRRFYELYRPRVIGALFFCGVRDPFDQEDAVSEVFFRFVAGSPWRERWETLPKHAVVMSYLRTSARNLVIDEARRSKAFPPETDPSIEPVAEESAYIGEILGKIGDRDRLFMTEYIDEGYSLKRTAAALGMSYGAAGTRLHRIRRKLQPLLSRRDVKKTGGGAS